MNSAPKITTLEKRIFTNADLARLFLPIIIEQFLEYSVGLISSLMAAHVSEDAVSAVSLVEFIVAFFISIFSALAAGGSVVAGQYLGARQVGNAKAVVNQLIWFSLILSVLVMICMLLERNFILDVIFGEISAQIRSLASIYLLFSCISLPFIAVYAAAAGAFRTANKAKIPMYIMGCMNILNVILTLFFIYGLKFGIIGLALPVLITRVLAAIIVIYLLLDMKFKLHLKRSLKFRLNSAMIKRILNIAIPYGFENSMFYIGRIVILSLIATFGTAAIAANAVGGTIAMFQILPGMAIGVGFGVIVSRCLGAGDFRLVQFYTKKILILVYVFQIFSIGAVLAVLDPLLGIYNLSPQAAAMTKQLVWWHGVAMILFWPPAYTIPIVFRSAGDVKFTMWVSVAAMFLCRIALAYILSLNFGLGMIGTWFAMFADWAFKGLLFVWRYFSGEWMKFNVLK